MFIATDHANNTRNDEIESAMREITRIDDESVETQKEALFHEIFDLETNLVTANKLVEHGDFNRSTISPEESNERQKSVVFLKKDLVSKKSEYAELR